MPQVLDEAPRVTRDEGRAEAEVPEAEEEAGRAVLLPAAARRVLGRTGSLGSALADAVRRVGALVMLRTVAVEALVLMEEMEVSREESVSWSDCIDSLRRDVDTLTCLSMQKKRKLYYMREIVQQIKKNQKK